MYSKILVIGAGPGALQLGYELNQFGHKEDYLILERASVAGSFFEKFPIHRKLISINKVNTGYADSPKNLRWDWNSLLTRDGTSRFQEFDTDFFPHADSMVSYLSNFAITHDLPVFYNTNVTNITRSATKNRFEVETDQGEVYTCDYLILGTGLNRSHEPDIAGIDLCQNYTELCLENDDLIDKDILIIGKGNSAFETAEELIPLAANLHLVSPNYLRLAWDTHYPGDVRAINNNILDMFFLKQQSAVLNGTVTLIEAGCEGKLRVQIQYTEDGYTVDYEYDRVITCCGFKFDTELFSEPVMPELGYENKLPLVTAEWESVNVGQMYFVGALSQSNDYRKSASAFVHGFRFNARTLAKILAAKLTGQSWTAISRQVEDLDSLLREIYKLVDTSTSLWHMFDSMCDVFVLTDEGTVEHHSDIPDGALASGDFENFTGFTFSFTVKNPSSSKEDKEFSEHGFNHPVVRFYYLGVLASEWHMLVDPVGEWTDKSYYGKGLREFLGSSLKENPTGA